MLINNFRRLIVLPKKNFRSINALKYFSSSNDSNDSHDHDHNHELTVDKIVFFILFLKLLFFKKSIQTNMKKVSDIPGVKYGDHFLAIVFTCKVCETR